MIADRGRRADNHAGSVIDEEIFSDGRTGMNIDSGGRMRVFRHHTRNQRHIQKKKLMRQTIDRRREQSRIGKNNLVLVISCRISLIGCFDIRIDKRPHGRNPAAEGQGDAVRLIIDLCVVRMLLLRGITKDDGDLLA